MVTKFISALLTFSRNWEKLAHLFWFELGSVTVEMIQTGSLLVARSRILLVSPGNALDEVSFSHHDFRLSVGLSAYLQTGRKHDSICCIVCK